LTRDYRALFPQLPERTRLLRLFQTRQAWAEVFVAAPTVLGLVFPPNLDVIFPAIPLEIHELLQQRNDNFTVYMPRGTGGGPATPGEGEFAGHRGGAGG